MEKVIERDGDLSFITERLGLKNPSDYFIFPKYIEIETVRGCNARCIMCPLSVDDNYKKGLMTDALFKKIVDQFSEYIDFLNQVCLSRNGEPLIDKNLPEKIKILKKIGIKRVNFSTNASLLNEDMAKRLIESGLDEIRFSIEGFTKETFEAIRLGLNFDTVIENCLRFIKLRDEMNVNLQIQIRLTESEKNVGEIKQWRNFWLSKLKPTDLVASKRMHSWGNKLDTYEGENIDFQNPCISPFSTLEIFYDGVIPLCGCDYKPEYLLGNLNESTIKEIWQSNEFENYRKIHLSGERFKMPICDRCNIWETDEVRTIYKKE